MISSKNMNYFPKTLACSMILLFSMTTRAELLVIASAPKSVGKKVVVKLKLMNSFPEKIESARAVAFLLDEKSKMVGQSTKWVIGGTKANPALESGKETTFNFVLHNEKPSATNLNWRIGFIRVVLEGGKLADPNKQVIIQGQSEPR